MDTDAILHVSLTGNENDVHSFTIKDDSHTLDYYAIRGERTFGQSKKEILMDKNTNLFDAYSDGFKNGKSYQLKSTDGQSYTLRATNTVDGGRVVMVEIKGKLYDMNKLLKGEKSVV